jgi:hypothetical protein
MNPFTHAFPHGTGVPSIGPFERPQAKVRFSFPKIFLADITVIFKLRHIAQLQKSP